jgi:hypothetical protein
MASRWNVLALKDRKNASKRKTIEVVWTNFRQREQIWRQRCIYTSDFALRFCDSRLRRQRCIPWSDGKLIVVYIYSCYWERSLYQCVFVCVEEREWVKCVCVCVCQRESVSEHQRERERECVCVCVCVCVAERESVCVWTSERERVSVSERERVCVCVCNVPLNLRTLCQKISYLT